MKRMSAFAPLIATSLTLSMGCADAHASDDAFLLAIEGQGLAPSFSSPDNEISEAKRMCAGLRDDQSSANANAIAFVLDRDHRLNRGQGEWFINIAIDFYCPEVPHPQF